MFACVSVCLSITLTRLYRLSFHLESTYLKRRLIDVRIFISLPLRNSGRFAVTGVDRGLLFTELLVFLNRLELQSHVFLHSRVMYSSTSEGTLTSCCSSVPTSKYKQIAEQSKLFLCVVADYSNIFVNTV